MAFARSVVFSVSLLSLLGSTVPAWAQYQVLEADRAGANEEYRWAISVEDGEFSLSGQVPYEWVADILRERAGSDTVADLDVVPGAPPGFLPDALTAIDAIGLLEEGAIAFGDGVWRVTGRMESDADREALEQLLPSTGPGSNWIIDIDDSEQRKTVAADVVDAVEQMLEEAMPTPDEEAIFLAEDTSDAEPSAEVALAESEQQSVSIEVAEGEAIESESVPQSANADLAAQCEAEVEEYMEGRAIQFSSGSARLTAESAAIVSDVAQVLAVCPSTPVYVEGHTDADGRAETNVVLSLARAEAVVDGLVGHGVDPSRLFAVGYGASLPIASNETAVGKAANRRIVFSFQDIAE